MSCCLPGLVRWHESKRLRARNPMGWLRAAAVTHFLSLDYALHGSAVRIAQHRVDVMRGTACSRE